MMMVMMVMMMMCMIIMMMLMHDEPLHAVPRWLNRHEASLSIVAKIRITRGFAMM
jgi:hypothetical protein